MANLISFYILVLICSCTIIHTSTQPIVISDTNIARPFYGIGAISGGGATSRTLFDYPEPHRSQILDLLFTPGVGAALQAQKVEIAADADTTCGSEVTHIHDIADGGSYHRGYEWWILTESKKRQPTILTSALQWAAPKLVSDPNIDNGNTLFTPANIDYVLNWLYGLSTVYNITLDYLSGGWNEHPYNSTYVKLLRSSLNNAGYPNIRVTASDEWDPNRCWDPIYDLLKDPELAAAIDAISVHVAGKLEHNDPTPAVGVALGIPIFQGEEHIGLPDPDPVPNYDWAAAASVGIEINENWVLNNMSSTIYWPDIYAWYSGITYRGKGLLTATSPWGNASYYVPTTLWMVAHTTHFTEARTWFLLNESSSGHVPNTDGNVSYVTYVGSESEYTIINHHTNMQTEATTRPFTIVIESLFEGPYHSTFNNTFSPVTVTFQLSGTLSSWIGSSLNVWHTNQTVTFEPETSIVIANDGTFTLTIEPAAIYTLTTVTSSHPGARKYLASLVSHAIMIHSNGTMERPSTNEIIEYNTKDGPMDDPFPIPYMDDFEGYVNDTLPLYTSDMFGAFTIYNITSDPEYNHHSPIPLRYTYQNDSYYNQAIICSSNNPYAAQQPRCVSDSLSSNFITSSNNHVLRQYTRESPLGWSTESTNMATIIGNYTLQGIQLNISVLIEVPTWPMNQTNQEYFYLGLRSGSGQLGYDQPSTFYGKVINAYAWTMNVQGQWALYDSSSLLIQGTYNTTVFTYNTWYDVSFVDIKSTNTLIGYINNNVVFTFPLPSNQIRNHGGYVMLGSGCNRVQYDNLVLDWSEK